ncbi:MAG: cadherin-like domain-containing protein [bacterium]
MSLTQNSPPVAHTDAISTDEDASVPITLTGSDIENDPLTFTVVDNPVQGTLSGTPPDLTYSPNTDYHGPDSFTFQVNDGTIDSPTATVTITVNPVNDVPIAESQDIRALAGVALPIILHGTDVDVGDFINFQIVQNPVHGVLQSWDPVARSVWYLADSHFEGQDAFVFSVSDGHLISMATITLFVEQVVPTATSTPTPTDTPVPPTFTPMLPSPTPTATATPTSIPTLPPTSTPTLTPTEDSIPTFTPTSTPTFTNTPQPMTPTFAPTPTATANTTPTSTPTLTPLQTSTPTSTRIWTPTWTPISTPTPTFTSIPTSTPTATPTVTPTPSPTPVVITLPENTVEVFDDLFSTIPLIGLTDFDPLEDRQLVVRWHYAGNSPITDWHVYVRKGDGGYFYLGHTDSGDNRRWTWVDPDFNTQYQFQVWGLYKNEAGRLHMIVLSQPGPMGYNLEGGKTIQLKNISNPTSLPPGTAKVVDDLFHTRDLSGGTDTDFPLHRALALKFNPGAGAFLNTHVYISTNGVNYTYLGQTGAADLAYFRFDANDTFSLNPSWQNGPQDGLTYWFRVFALKAEGGSVRMETGPVAYSLDTPPAVSAPVEV